MLSGSVLAGAPLAGQVASGAGGTAWTADVSLALTASQSTAGTLAAVGAVTLALTASQTTAGTRATFGDVSLALTAAQSTAGTLAAVGNVAIPITAAQTTAGTRATFGDVTIPITDALAVTASGGSTAWTADVRIALTAGVAIDQRIQGKTGSWYGLLDTYREAEAERRYEAATYPIACPNDGEPLILGPDGRKFCPFDGYRP